MIKEQLTHLKVPFGHLAIWALGQHGFLFKGGDHVVIIDPYLSIAIEERSKAEPVSLARMVPIVIQPAELDLVDLVLVTHHHADHCDPQTLRPLLNAASQAQLVTSYKARDLLTEEGFDLARITVPMIEQPLQFGTDLQVTAIPAAHYEHEPDAHGNPAYLGFIISLNGVTLYHSGDSIIYPGLEDRLRAQPIDLACLPINGRDWFREQDGLVGNMDYREAAELAVRAGVKVLLPAHNDLFKGNRINPAYLIDYLQANHPAQRVHLLQAGELYYYVA